jgi:putative DNA primase/helicase
MQEKNVSAAEALRILGGGRDGSDPVATYDYTDEAGKILFQCVRFQPKDFRQRQPDDKGGWQWNLASVRRVLYRLPELLRGLKRGLPVIVPEGEKDVDALANLGLPAVVTCNVGGAGKWRGEYSDSLRGASVFVIADKDKPGREHGQQVAASLHAKAKRVSVLELPDRQGCKVKDASDWLAAGGNIGELMELLHAAPEWAPSQDPPGPQHETDEEAFARLGTLSPAEYDRCRKEEAERLRMRPATLDHEVMARRPNLDVTAQGSALEFPKIELWQTPVNGAVVLTEIAAIFSRYLGLPPGAADVLALWTAHAHAFEAFTHTPRLNFCSPDKGCGKTTALDVLASITPRPLRTESITAAVLFRLVELHKPTLLLDEVDAYLNQAEELRGLLNAGHKRGAKAYRCEGENNTVRGFAAFAPAALAGIGALPGTLHDRAIVVSLARAKPGEVAARFDSRRTEWETDLCRKLARWAADNFDRLKSCDPELPETAFNRLADNWRPLFAIAEVAGGDWRQQAAAAFVALTATADLDAQGVGTILLADIADLFAPEATDKLPSSKLAEALAAIEGRPWAEWGKHRKPISPNQLANQLRRFGVSPRAIRVGDETPRGYLLADFQEAFDRYLPKASVSDRNSATTLGNLPVFKPQQAERVLHSEAAQS